METKKCCEKCTSEPLVNSKEEYACFNPSCPNCHSKQPEGLESLLEEFEKVCPDVCMCVMASPCYGWKQKGDCELRDRIKLFTVNAHNLGKMEEREVLDKVYNEHRREYIAQGKAIELERVKKLVEEIHIELHNGRLEPAYILCTELFNSLTEGGE